MDTLANALVNIKNCEAIGKPLCVIKPASKMIGNILKLMQKQGYVGNFELVDDGKAGYYKVQLLGKINNCRAIKPRYAVGRRDFTKFEKRYLLAKDFGILILSTPKGIMTHERAKKLEIGGKLLAFVY